VVLRVGSASGSVVGVGAEPVSMVVVIVGDAVSRIVVGIDGLPGPPGMPIGDGRVSLACVDDCGGVGTGPGVGSSPITVAVLSLLVVVVVAVGIVVVVGGFNATPGVVDAEPPATIGKVVVPGGIRSGVSTGISGISGLVGLVDDSGIALPDKSQTQFHPSRSWYSARRHKSNHINQCVVTS
jgi:hypothetical protein